MGRQSQGEALESQVDAVHLESAELVFRWRVAIAAEQRDAGADGLVGAGAASGQRRRLLGAARPIPDARGEQALVRNGVNAQHRLRPCAGRLPRVERRHGLVPHIGLGQPQVLEGEEHEGAVGAHRPAQRLADFVEPRRAPAQAGLVGEPIVGRQIFIAPSVVERAVPKIRAGLAGDGDLRSRQASHFGAGAGGANGKLVHHFGRDQRIQAAERAYRRQGSAGRLRRNAASGYTVVGADPIHREVVRVGPLPGGGELPGFAARGGRDIGGRRGI